MSINITSLASGSSGNCYLVTDGSTPLLLECGIPIALIKKGCGFNVHGMKACLISHGH